MDKRNFLTGSFLFILQGMIMFHVGFVYAQDEAGQELQPETPAPAAEIQAAAETQSPLETTAAEQPETEAPLETQAQPLSGSGNVSLDFRDADVRNVLQVLALKSGINIVASPEVTGAVNIQLKDVPWQQALEVILSTLGYVYERKGNIIFVTTVDNLKKHREDATLLAQQEPVETKTFTLNFGKASEIIQSIEKMKTARGQMNFDERTNTIIVTDTRTSIELMEGVIKQLDATTPQVLIEAKVVETTLSNSENLGIDWTIKVTAQGAARPILWPFSTVTDNKLFAGTGAFPSTASTDFKFGTLNFNDLQAVLQFLKTKSDTNILSSPHIMTLDNKAAQITVGSQYPIPTYTYNEEQARLQVSGWEYKDIGIIFNVTPHVNKAGFVTLDIEPKITAILDYVTVENTSLPRLSNESTKTSVMIKDGETVVIGGLIKDQTTDTKKKVPFIGDIPILGLAFQKKETSVTKTDLLIFITPHVVTPQITLDQQ